MELKAVGVPSMKWREVLDVSIGLKDSENSFMGSITVPDVFLVWLALVDALTGSIKGEDPCIGPKRVLPLVKYASLILLEAPYPRSQDDDGVAGRFMIWF